MYFPKLGVLILLGFFFFFLNKRSYVTKILKQKQLRLKHCYKGGSHEAGSHLASTLMGTAGYFTKEDDKEVEVFLEVEI